MLAFGTERLLNATVTPTTVITRMTDGRFLKQTRSCRFGNQRTHHDFKFLSSMTNAQNQWRSSHFRPSTDAVGSWLHNSNSFQPNPFEL